MDERRHKIPLKLHLVRMKNSRFVLSCEHMLYRLKPKRTYQQKTHESEPQKILFIRADRIGDAIVTLPVLRDLKLNRPKLRIHVLASRRNGFIFDGLADKVIIFEPGNTDDDSLHSVFRLPVIGHFLQFLFFLLLPYLKGGELRKNIDELRKEKYDAAIDLVGKRRTALLAKMVSRFTAGSRLFLLSWLYDYYLNVNWVSAYDRDFMSRKIERLINNSLGIVFDKRNTSLPYKTFKENGNKEFDIMVHLGTSELRKFPLETEKKILDELAGFKLLITDAGDTPRYKYYKDEFLKNKAEFRLYNSLEEVSADADKCRLLLCYDGGQAHYLSQYIRTFAIFGPGSEYLWKPYEFKEYNSVYEKNGTVVSESVGTYKHLTVKHPIWCNPCFDIGCEKRPCLNRLDINMIIDAVKNILNEG